MMIINFRNSYELSDAVKDLAERGKEVTATLFYEDAVELMRNLLLFDNVKVKMISLSPSEIDGYDKEYYVSLSSDQFLFVEPAYKNKKYLGIYPDIMFIDGNASYSIIRDLPEGICREIHIGHFDADQYYTRKNISRKLEKEPLEQIKKLFDIIDN